MNIDEIITKNKILEEELQKTKDELSKTKEHLKKYTAPSNKKTKTWIETQKRNPAFQISSFTTSGNKEVEKVRPS